MAGQAAIRRISVSVFVCYAHADNSAAEPQLRWLDRLLEFLRPLVRYGQLASWSDKEIEPGAVWGSEIGDQLDAARAAILLVSPAFLASDYIAHSEVPVLLMRARERSELKILPIIISPCLYEETRFKYPNWEKGPHELLLGTLQSINPPSRTLIEMTEGEQNRVFLVAARQLRSWLAQRRWDDDPWSHDKVEEARP